jgi:hypothetical protein
MTGIRLTHVGIATAIGLVMLLIGSGCLSRSSDGGGLGGAVPTVISHDQVGHARIESAQAPPTAAASTPGGPMR